MRITILEFTPCADSIYHVRRDAEEGYIAGDQRSVTIRSGAKLRPRMVSTYAGGKATNVARVMDKLLNFGDAVEIELVVFRPDSPEGRYIHDLQTVALTRAKVCPVIIRGRARTCVDLIDPTTDRINRVEFNISPRAVWEASALDTALDYVKGLSTDLLMLAGNPPVIEQTGEMAVGLYAEIIEELRARVEIVSVDTEMGALGNCLKARSKPDVIKINDREKSSVESDLWSDFTGEMIVTTANGCHVWASGPQSPHSFIRGAEVNTLYSTIGAGDSVHAGFALARWVWGYDIKRAALYGQAVAASSVSSPDGTRGVTKSIVEKFFSELGAFTESPDNF